MGSDHGQGDIIVFARNGIHAQSESCWKSECGSTAFLDPCARNGAQIIPPMGSGTNGTQLRIINNVDTENRSTLSSQ
jgi:hypothetical protein